MIVADDPQDHLSYDSETGEFRWKRRAQGRSISRAAGAKESDGYLTITVGGVRHRAHRLAWLFFYGCWPASETDHINGQRDDNRISNLRAADRSGNAHNTGIKSTNTSGAKGVRFRKGAWEASCMVHGKRTYLGRHKTRDRAVAAYAAFAAERVGPFFNPAIIKQEQAA
jgi:hypothetical protein